MYPNRHGELTSKNKAVDSKSNLVLNNHQHLLQHIQLCEEKPASYFGLLTKGDCVAVSYYF